MSSISASDRRNQTDELRNQREEYQNRETDQAKRHKKEIKRILSRHDQEIQEIKDTYQKQISTLKERSNKNLTERDVENQAKIEKLRSAYTESLRKRPKSQRAVEILSFRLCKNKSRKTQRSRSSKKKFYAEISQTQSLRKIVSWQT